MAHASAPGNLRTLVALLLAGGLACQGAIVGDQQRPAGPAAMTPPGKDPVTMMPVKPTPPGKDPVTMPDPTKPIDPTTMIDPLMPADPEAAGPMPLRRLTRREYNNTVRDLLGDNTAPADGFPPDKDEGFLFARAGLVSSQDFSTLRDAAESLAAAAEKNAATIAPCAAGTAEEACARAFVTGFGLRAYRRPLLVEETNRLMALYQGGRATLMLTHAGGIRLMVEAILQSPFFLYHWEGGHAAPVMEGKVVRLGHYENASRLSYFLWGSMPDTALFEAAAANHLGTAAELEAHARRMLGDERVRQTLEAFSDAWLNLDQVTERPKDPAAYPEWKDELKAAMLAESRAFVNSVVLDGDGKLATLLTTRSGFVNQTLAAVYGVTGVQGAAMVPVMLDPAQRSGLLTRAGYLAVAGSTNGSHPVKRGRTIFERILCGELPPQPPEVPPVKPASAGGTTRQRFAEHAAMECAAVCHGLMDPLGFAFEHYDGIGKYRTTDNGGAIDATGIINLDGKKQPFNDARDLSQLLAGSDGARECMVKQWTRFALGRGETEGDRASMQAIAAAFAKSDGSIRELLVAVATSRSFRYRTPAAGPTM